MNERIKELSRLAQIFANANCDDEFGSVDESKQRNSFQEKFAELIVRECANVCYDHSNAAGGVDTHFGYGYKDCGDDIKRVFGVKG